MRVLSLAAVLFVFWLLLSGHYTAFLVAGGALTALAIAMFGRHLGYADREGHPIELLPAGLIYWPWLVKEIVVAAVKVSALILRPSLPISPRLIPIATSQDGPVGVTIYANSITLTPGTITVRVDRPEHAFLVHALTRESAEGLVTGEMDRRVTKMAGKL